MKLRTFYRIYYRHRVKKASIILKIYLLIIIPLKYSKINMINPLKIIKRKLFPTDMLKFMKNIFTDIKKKDLIL